MASHAVPGFTEPADRLSQDRLAAGEGLAGLALARREPVLTRDLSQEQPRPGRAVDSRLRSALAVPVIGHAGKVLGVGEFFSQRDLGETGLTGTLSSIAAQFGQHLDRLRAEAATQQAKEDLIATVSHDLRAPLTSIAGWLAGDPADREARRADRGAAPLP